MTIDKQISSEVAANRSPEYDISPLIVNRWSPRSFQERSVSDQDLYAVMEAARWAPSASNEQPWRFVVAKTSAQKEQFHTFVNEGNLIWCKHAPILILAIAKTTNAKEAPNRWHAFDTGTAWGFLALEAARRGLITHAMGGFDVDKARSTLSIPEIYAPQALIALGYRAEAELLPEQLRERERPSTRKPLEEIIIEGSFN
ncbi:nitroreductase family protein [Paenibacillus abyssi]|uniref:Nitroreductase n=1 Tax=Paenibacillus abyssi TaxID=1340531 RepID=A0A917CJP6_9BACL|nr:nitroreductase family protein [Paenibacillus abyssi]GGF89837.1 nitroreductase [Paenibacillus abyssi]